MKNPIINSPYLEPNRHFKADERGIRPQKIQSDRLNESNTPIHGGVCVGAKGLEPLTFSV